MPTDEGDDFYSELEQWLAERKAQKAQRQREAVLGAQTQENNQPELPSAIPQSPTEPQTPEKEEEPLQVEQEPVSVPTVPQTPPAPAEPYEEQTDTNSDEAAPPVSPPRKKHKQTQQLVQPGKKDIGDVIMGFVVSKAAREFDKTKK